MMLPSRIFFDDFFDDIEPKREFRHLDSMMKCDIYEKDGIFNIELDVPGFKKDEVKMELEDGYLKVTAEKNFEESDEDKDKKYIRRERRYQAKCERQFYVGDIDEDKVKANFKDGTLFITVPKEDKEKNSKKYIDIK